MMWEEVARSFDLDGKQVVVTDEELASVQPRKTRTIDVEGSWTWRTSTRSTSTIPTSSSPPGRARALPRLQAARGDHGPRRARGAGPVRDAHEGVPGGAVGARRRPHDHDDALPRRGAARGRVPAGGKKPTKKALDNAIAVIEELSTDWDPERYTDCYRERLRPDRGQAQAAEDRGARAEKQPSPAPDLMAALERTLANARAGKDIRADEDGERDEPAKAESKRG